MKIKYTVKKKIRNGNRAYYKKLITNLVEENDEELRKSIVKDLLEYSHINIDEKDYKDILFMLDIYDL